LHQLEAIGHQFRRISLRGELRMGYGAAVLVRDGKVIAGADPRRSGAAAAVKKN
jgi:gamma-glutamyltranspeptidase